MTAAIYNKISRLPKTQAQVSFMIKKCLKFFKANRSPVKAAVTSEESSFDMSKSLTTTRSLKDNQDQYYNEKVNKLNTYWRNKSQRQSDVRHSFFCLN